MFKVKLEIFEGPLDLLLYLVKREDLEIFDIPISKITEQYLEYLEVLKLLELNIACEYLVVASQLLQIKSKKLLPQEEPTGEEPEELDLKEELMRRLEVYARFKEVAKELKEKEIQRSLLFKRGVTERKEEEEKEVYFEANLFDLISVFSNVLKEVKKEEFLEVIKDEFTIQDKIHDILHLLLVQSRIRLRELFERAKNRLEVVAIFLAILELIRLKEILCRQKALFGEIEIIRNTERLYSYERR